MIKKLWAWGKADPFNHFLNILILIGGVVMLGIVGVLFYAVGVSWWQGNSITDNDALRNLIFAIGGVGAAIGLRFAKIRQDKFSDQVQTQIDQVKIQFDQGFNDRLGRGGRIACQ